MVCEKEGGCAVNSESGNDGTCVKETQGTYQRMHLLRADWETLMKEWNSWHVLRSCRGKLPLPKSIVGVFQAFKDNIVKYKTVLMQEEGVDVMNRETAHER